jgi:hypothetical protein
MVGPRFGRDFSRLATLAVLAALASFSWAAGMERAANRTVRTVFHPMAVISGFAVIAVIAVIFSVGWEESDRRRSAVIAKDLFVCLGVCSVDGMF